MNRCTHHGTLECVTREGTQQSQRWHGGGAAGSDGLRRGRNEGSTAQVRVPQGNSHGMGVGGWIHRGAMDGQVIGGYRWVKIDNRQIDDITR